MPVHRIPKTHVHEDVTDIERQGERIVSVIVEDDRYVIFTEFLRPRLEVRSRFPTFPTTPSEQRELAAEIVRAIRDQRGPASPGKEYTLGESGPEISA